MGYAIARVARRRGATVTLVSGPVALPVPPDVRVVSVESAAEMAAALRAAFPKATVLVMAAAVADYRPLEAHPQKLKKAAAGRTLALVRTSDILTGLAAAKRARIVVGFAAETQHVVGEARRKLRTKRLDLVVANDVTAPGAGFGSDTNVVHLIDATGRHESLPVLPKDDVASRLLDWVVARRAARIRPPRSGARESRLRSTRERRPSA